MIHHVSIPARDPAHVAKVLSELTGWPARPFLGPVPGAIMLLAEDAHGTGIEIYPEDTTMTPGQGDEQTVFHTGQAPGGFPFHFLLSLDTDRETVKRLGEREGWRTLNCWRGPPDKPVFELIEFWIENRVMIEIATPDMVPNYVKMATARAHDEFIASLNAPVHA